MTRHHCAQCGRNIANGDARLRSESFQQIAICPGCAELEEATTGIDAFIPGQRTAPSRRLHVVAGGAG